MFSQATLLLALAASATAHMKMKFPVPYADGSLNNSPLAPGDYPCKQRPGGYEITTMNQWNAGETKSVSFYGSAVHGGGSCQFSITSDMQPSASTQFKVIHSVIGGCPAAADGNLPGGPESEGAGTFPVTLPADTPEGTYTFAWSWINKIGNREFYMNCAPIQVGSGSGSASTASVAEAFSALPDMFVANLPDTECSTAEGQDFVYPNPGQSVSGTRAKPGNTLSGSGCTKQNAMGAGNGQMGSPAPGSPSTPSKPSSAPSQPQASEQPVSTPSTPTAPKESKIPTNPGGVFAPGASSAPASGPTAQPNPPVSKPSAPPAVKPVPTPTPEAPKVPDNNTTPVSGQCTPCTNDGAVVCIGSKQFGLCNRGCAVAQDLALGMACKDGVVVAATKRHIHFPRGHLHRRLSAARLL